MRYRLAIGDRNYSSWSLRSWLLFERFAIPHDLVRVHLDAPDFLEELQPFAPTRTVPALDLGDVRIFDTIAIAETLAERYPALALWPADPDQRARARTVVAEMHAGFAALRGDCPMNLRRAYAGFEPSDAVRADLARIEALWAYAGLGQDWLFGGYSIADAFYAPVAARIATYGLAVGPEAAAYVARTLADPAFRRWRAIGMDEASVHLDCDLDLPARPWPGPEPLPARVVAEGAAVNAACPFSGRAISPAALAEIAGVTIGFCNPFCRDKVVADPEAWPEAMEIVARARG